MKPDYVPAQMEMKKLEKNTTAEEAQVLGLTRIPDSATKLASTPSSTQTTTSLSPLAVSSPASKNLSSYQQIGSQLVTSSPVAEKHEVEKLKKTLEETTKALKETQTALKEIKQARDQESQETKQARLRHEQELLQHKQDLKKVEAQMRKLLQEKQDEDVSSDVSVGDQVQIKAQKMSQSTTSAPRSRTQPTMTGLARGQAEHEELLQRLAQEVAILKEIHQTNDSKEEEKDDPNREELFSSESKDSNSLR